MVETRQIDSRTRPASLSGSERGENTGYVYSARVDDSSNRLSLIEYLCRRYRHSDRDQWLARIDDGRVLVNGRIRTQEEPVLNGDRLDWHRPPWVEPHTPSGFAVAYRDAELLVVVKPSGLPTLPGADYLEQTLLHRVRRFDSKASPLHRLGRATSGLVVFSRSRSVHRRLSENWRLDVHRWYRALVHGSFPDGHHQCDDPIGRLPNHRLGHVFGATPGGKPARSGFDLLERRGRTSLVRALIETGRPHQIRIHAAALGHPLVGDKLYGEGPTPTPDAQALPGNGGYQLHAERVRIRHPRLGRIVELDCQAPAKLRLTTAPGPRRCP